MRAGLTGVGQSSARPARIALCGSREHVDDLFLRSTGLVDEPRLSVDWLRASGAFNARFALTPDELRELQAGLEILIEPYATRTEADTPDDAASVRILAYFMPEARSRLEEGQSHQE